MIELYVPLNVFQLLGIWFVADFHRRVHYLDNPLTAGNAPLKLLGELYHPADRGEQGGDIQKIGH